MVLVLLSESPRRHIRSRDLGAQLAWDRSRLSHHLARMEKRGLVARTDCPDDRRGLMVRLTPAGRRAIEDAAPVHVQGVRQYFVDLLSADELAALASLFDRLLDNLSTGQPAARETSPGSP
jgi:DNA-binding MarR family transcriptional regulator